MKTTSFGVRGMHCASCAVNIERELKSVHGVQDANVNSAMEKASITYDDTKIGLHDLHVAVKKAGYEPVMGDMPEHMSHGNVFSGKRVIIAVILGIPLIGSMFIGLHIQTQFAAMICAWILVVFVGFPFHAGAWKEIRRMRTGMDTLVSLGTSAALLWSTYAFFTRRVNELYFEVAGIIIVFLLIGKYLEARQRARAGEAIRSLMNVHSVIAHIVISAKAGISSSSIKDIDPKELHIGDICQVKPGEQIPIDGEIIEGISSIDESMLTGESVSIEKIVKSKVFAGTINGNGSFLMRVMVEPGNTALDAIVKTVEHALSTKSPVEKFVDRISGIFVPIVIISAIATLIIWIFLGHGFGEAIKHAVAVLIVACPCAMGLATPAAIMVGTGKGAKKGILIKDGSALEAAHNISMVVFDKTGTLTEGKPKVTDILHAGVDRKDILQSAGSVEMMSEHPLAKAVLKLCEEEQIGLYPAEHVKAIVGKGVEGLVNGRKIILGTDVLLEELGVAMPHQVVERARELRCEGKTLLFVVQDKIYVGLIAVRDVLKKDSVEAVALLQKNGIKVAMITGGHLDSAAAISKELGLKEIFAQVLPIDKAGRVKKMQDGGERVAFVGDGINDAPALAQADLGIAMGTGTDVAMATGQIVLMGGSPLKAGEAIELARRTFTAIQQNLFWAFAYNAIGIPLAAIGILNPMLASAAMALSSVSVLTNSLRIARKR